MNISPLLGSRKKPGRNLFIFPFMGERKVSLVRSERNFGGRSYEYFAAARLKALPNVPLI